MVQPPTSSSESDTDDWDSGGSTAVESGEMLQDTQPEEEPLIPDSRTPMTSTTVEAAASEPRRYPQHERHAPRYFTPGT